MNEQPKSECKGIDKPELETLSYKPEQPEFTGHCPKCGQDWKTHKYSCKDNRANIPEQPNTELLIVKTIQGLMSAASRELTELNKITSIAKHKVLIDQVLEDITSTERTTLFELQKAFE